MTVCDHSYPGTREGVILVVAITPTIAEPLALDPFDHNTAYYGCQVMFKTTNAGSSWSVISPDLSTQDPAHIVSSGGLIGDNLGQFYGEVVFAIAPSEVQRGLIWAVLNSLSAGLAVKGVGRARCSTARTCSTASLRRGPGRAKPA